MNISDKLLTYISNHENLTTDMINQYKNSLIFIGDEQQIYVPLTNSYVGVGISTINDLRSSITQANGGVSALKTHVDNNVVTSIKAGYDDAALSSHFNGNPNAESISGTTVTANSYEYQLTTNQDVVLVGVNNYDVTNHTVKTTDEIGRTTSYNLGNADVANQTLPAYGNSGISVKVKHTGNHVSGSYEGFNYSYFEGQDYLVIDDSATWSYIAANNAYLTQYATYVAVAQANRVFHDILGDDTHVYIEKKFDEAFFQDGNGEYQSINTVFVKTTDTEHPYQAVTVTKDSNTGDTVFKTNNDTNTITIYTIHSDGSVDFDPAVEGTYLAEVGGKTAQAPVWYHVDNTGVSTYNTNLADGIQTLKEVAYILDRITDGDETGIGIAYNIATNTSDISDLKEWKDNIGAYVVNKFQSSSLNELLTVSYYNGNPNNWDSVTDSRASGDVHLDIDLEMAKFRYETIEGTTVKLAAWNASQQSMVPNKLVAHLDPSNLSNYVEITNDNVADLEAKLNALGITGNVSVYTFNSETNKMDESSTPSVNSLGSNIGNYIYYPYTESTADPTIGLTNVEWVVAYVGETRKEIMASLGDNVQDLTDAIDTAINALDSSYTAGTGQFIGSITQEDGKLTNATYINLPTDTINGNDLLYNADIYVHISAQEAVSMSRQNAGDVYYLNGTDYVALTTDATASNGDSYYYRKITPSLMGSPSFVSANTPISDIILNAGDFTYFKRSNNKFEPLDVQEELSNNSSLFSSGNVVSGNSIAYWKLEANSTKTTKYIDASSFHNEDGHNTLSVNAHVMPLANSAADNTGIADAWDVRHTIERMFTWIDLSTNKDYVAS